MPENTCPEWGCCCDHGRECCDKAIAGGGNYDHLGERGGCKRLPQCVDCTATRRRLCGYCNECPLKHAHV